MDVSFYGGRQGKSFIITKHYKSVKEMNYDFQNSTEVGYGEYVLISSPIQSLRNLENGLLFRRDLSGATYIGRIAGPPGYSPQIKIDSYNQIYSLSTIDQQNAIDDDGKVTTKSFSIDNKDLIPGYDGTNFNDTIDFVLDSVRVYTLKAPNNWKVQSADDSQIVLEHLTQKDDNGNVITKTISRNSEEIYEYVEAEETVALFGLKIPYHVFNFHAKSRSPYNQPNNLITEDTETFETDENGNKHRKHPFYSKWNLEVPHGIKGDSIENIRVVTSKDNVNGYPNEYKDGEAILVGDIRVYDNKQEGDVQTYFLSYFNDIKDVSLTSDGVITIDYAGNLPNDQLEHKLTWLTDIKIDDNYNLIATFNNNELTDKNNNKNEIHNLGRVKSDHPVAIGQVFTFAELGLEANSTIEQVESALNAKSPDGMLYDPSTKASDEKFGYLAAVGVSEDVNKQLYSFVTWLENGVEQRGWKHILTAASGTFQITDGNGINLSEGQLGLITEPVPSRTDWTKPTTAGLDESEILSTLEYEEDFNDSEVE